jgi:hypothetical protein
MLTNGTLTPAYGRDYKSAAAARADLAAGKDFVFSDYKSQGYVSASDLNGRFQLRYGNLRKVCSVTVVNGKVS